MSLRKVWLVTSGEYSDYSVEGVFSTKENAEAFIKAFPKQYDSYHEPEEWPLDMGVDKIAKGLKSFRVFLDFNTGELYPNYSTRTEDAFEGEFSTELTRLHNGGTIFTCNCWAKTSIHAIKIAHDKWAQAKSEKVEGIELQ